MEETLIAFADFVRDNPEEMAQIDSVERGIAILNLLAERNSADRLVPMTYHLLFGDQLLLHLNGLAANKNETAKFHLAIADLSSDYMGDAWSISTISKIFADADFRNLVEQCPALLNEDHPLYGRLSLDPYWERRVRRYLIRGDYRRTWDELNKARRGFPKLSDARPDTVSHSMNRPDVGETIFKGPYACSKELLAILIGDLFLTMVNEGSLIPITDEDKTLAAQKLPRRVFELNPTKGGRKIRSYELQGCTVSGFGFACMFRLQEGYMYPDHGGWSRRTPKLHVFNETGAQVLKIAGYFAKQKDDRRRKKYEEALQRQLEKSKGEKSQSVP